MRFYEFKQTLTTEISEPTSPTPAPQNAEEYIDIIQDKASKAPLKTQQAIANGLDTVAEWLKRKIEKITDRPVDLATQEGIESAINEKAQNVEYLLATAKEAGFDLSKDPKVLKAFSKMVAFHMGDGGQITHEELNKIKLGIEGKYTALANKITKGGPGFAPIVPKPDNDDTEAMDYYNEMAKKRAILSKTGVLVRDSIADMVNGLMEKAGREIQVKDAEKELKRIDEFLSLCITDPFINFDNMISKPKGTVTAEFTSSEKGKQYIDIYEKFDNLLVKTIDKSGAGAWGPGELGLLMLADPVKKGKKGDIETGAKKQVEVKASKKANSGARLNIELAKKGDMTNAYTEVLRKYFGPKVQHQMPEGQINFTTKGFGILNSFVDQLIEPKVEAKGKKETSKWNRTKAIQFLIDAVNLPMENYMSNKEYVKEIKVGMASAVSKKGHFLFEAFQHAYTKLLFLLYKAEMLDCILVINPLTGTFLVMNNPEDIKTAQKNGLVISGGIDFKDKQSTKSPQIGVA